MSAADSRDEAADDDLVAAEHALGVLDAAARARAERREAQEPAFAQAVQAWTQRFAPWLDAVGEVAPSAEVWPAIVARITKSPVDLATARRSQADRRPDPWRTAAAALASLAAVLALALVWPKPAATPARLMSATLASAAGRAGFVVTLDRAHRSLVLTPVGAAPVAGRSPELWVIPDGATPISLGVGAFDRTTRLPRLAAAGEANGLTLAVTLEPLGGSPTGKATGPIIASGRLTPL